MSSSTWEDAFSSWAQPPSKTEQEKCDNTANAIQKAVMASDALKNRSIRVFAQGSYRNRTNVRQDSDVDICVLCSDTIIPGYDKGVGPDDTDLSFPAAYEYPQFRNEVEAALVAYFGREQVKRGKKAFDVHANSYRVDADVVACFEHRRYTGYLTYVKPAGAAFFPDNGGMIINWPEQNYSNGVAKNDETGRRFKALVRIFKNLNNRLKDAGQSPIPSFLIECLLWNVPNEYFGSNTYTDDVRKTLTYLYNKTKDPEPCAEWGEINELKYLFRGSQPWTREQANGFTVSAWQHVGFE